MKRGLHAGLGRLAVRRRAAALRRRCAGGQRPGPRPRDYVHRRREAHGGDAWAICRRYRAGRSERSGGDADRPRIDSGTRRRRSARDSGGSTAAERAAAHRCSMDSGFEPGRVYEVDYRRRPARASPASGWPPSAMRRPRSAIAPTCRCADAAPTSSASRRAAASCVSSSTTASTSTSAIAACSISSGRTSPAPARDRSTSGSRCPATRRSRRRDSRSPIAEQADAAGQRDGILAALPPRSAAEGDLHEHVGRVLGPGTRGCADAHVARRHARPRRCPTTCACYLLAGTQHGEAAFPPRVRRTGQAHGQSDAAGQRHARTASRRRISGSSTDAPPRTAVIPTLRDDTLVRRSTAIALPGAFRVSAIRASSKGRDADGTLAAALPRAAGRCRRQRARRHSRARTGRCRWRRRPAGTSAPSASATRRRSVALLGSYVPFARTRAEREARRDPRPSIEERYKGPRRLPAADPRRGRALVKERLHARGRRRRRRAARGAALGLALTSTTAARVRVWFRSVRFGG